MIAYLGVADTDDIDAIRARLVDTRSRFRDRQTKRNAGDYLDALLGCECVGLIGDDEWLDSLSEIGNGLLKGSKP